ncbi:MAG: hypothetical protein QM756_09220 [Polyangiaceae bacterium]
MSSTSSGSTTPSSPRSTARYKSTKSWSCVASNGFHRARSSS